MHEDNVEVDVVPTCNVAVNLNVRGQVDVFVEVNGGRRNASLDSD
jgi:hypothetical protein